MAKKNNSQGSVREKILKSAIKLLSDCGIKKLAQPQIAKKAGVPQGHMTYYFPTRSDLLLAVAERSLQSIGEFLLKKAAQASRITPQDTLPLAIPLIKDKSRTRMLVGLFVESDENPTLRAKLKEQMHFAFDLIALSLNKDKNDLDVRLVGATLMGLGLQYYFNDQTQESKHQLTDDQLDQALNQLMTKFMET